MLTLLAFASKKAFKFYLLEVCDLLAAYVEFLLEPIAELDVLGPFIV